VKVTPVAFLVVKDGAVKVVSAQPQAETAAEAIMEAVPGMIEKIREILPRKKDETD
jgi:uncharacterized spore protein YtfJ